MIVFVGGDLSVVGVGLGEGTLVDGKTSPAVVGSVVIIFGDFGAQKRHHYYISPCLVLSLFAQFSLGNVDFLSLVVRMC